MLSGWGNNSFIHPVIIVNHENGETSQSGTGNILIDTPTHARQSTYLKSLLQVFANFFAFYSEMQFSILKLFMPYVLVIFTVNC